MNYRNIFIALATISGGISASAQAAESATVAFLMPDQASTRYEQHDFPGFKAEMSKLCAECKVIYQNANASATLQQQQFNSVIAQGAKIRLTPPRPPPWSKMPRLRMLK
jgi:D-xylose transport system substrate-binding protein